VTERHDALWMALSGGAEGADPAESTQLSLDGLARVVGAYCWLERRLFDLVGSWVASESVADAQLMFDVYSQQHAWHGELFEERLPALDSVDRAALIMAPDAAVDRMLSSLAGGGPAGSDAAGHPPSPAGGTLLRLVGLGRVVLPRLVAGYATGLRRVGAVSEAPVRRCLQLVLRDEVEEWQAFEALTETLLRRPHDVAVVTAHQQRLEEMVADGAPGLVSWPSGLARG